MSSNLITGVFNVDLGFPCTVDSPTVNSGAIGRVYAYNANRVQVHCLTASGSAKSFSDVTSWRAGYGLLGVGSAFVNVVNANISVSGALVTVLMPTTSATLMADLSTSSNKTYYLEIQGDKSDGIGWQTVLVWRIDCYNTMFHPAP